MIEGAGVVRSRQSLDAAGTIVDAMATAMGDATPPDRAHGELANLVTSARALLRSASVRHETRGAHARSDFPEMSEEWRRRIVHDRDGVVVVSGPTPSPRRPAR
jgi:aspartate oxidase